jgi:gluconolactonase
MAVERLSPKIDRIVPEGADVEELAAGFTSAEGPLWWAEGNYLLFSDWRPSRRYKWDPLSGVTLVSDATNHGNGQTRDLAGRLLVCENETGNGRLTATDNDGNVSILADRYQDRPLTSANDVVVGTNGITYFTAPAREGSGLEVIGSGSAYLFVEPTLDDKGRAVGRPAVYRAVSDGSGTAELLVEDFLVPNGLAFSADERKIYVVDTRRRHIRTFKVDAQGVLDPRSDRVFFEFNRVDRPGLNDGLKVDVEGNLYCTGPGGVWVIDSEGRHLGTILTGKNYNTNCAWGGKEWKTLFITTHESLLAIQLTIPGVRVPPS